MFDALSNKGVSALPCPEAGLLDPTWQRILVIASEPSSPAALGAFAMPFANYNTSEPGRENTR